MLHICIIVLCLPSIKDLLSFLCFRRWSLSVNMFASNTAMLIPLKINYYFFLPFFVCIFFSFNRIATKKTSRWLAAHPGQRYSLLFVFIENVLFERKLVPVLQHSIVKFKRVDWVYSMFFFFCHLSSRWKKTSFKLWSWPWTCYCTRREKMTPDK